MRARSFGPPLRCDQREWVGWRIVSLHRLKECDGQKFRPLEASEIVSSTPNPEILTRPSSEQLGKQARMKCPPRAATKARTPPLHHERLLPASRTEASLAHRIRARLCDHAWLEPPGSMREVEKKGDESDVVPLPANGTDRNSRHTRVLPPSRVISSLFLFLFAKLPPTQRVASTLALELLSDRLIFSPSHSGRSTWSSRDLNMELPPRTRRGHRIDAVPRDHARAT